jgi:inorganic pyrophosphatase
MVHPWHDITPAIENAEFPENFKAVIEIPQDSRNKYELDKGSGLLRLDRVIASAVFYPANYGFIPQTLGEDNDPLDVLVYCTEPIPPLCICNARAVGMMTMMDNHQADHKIVSVMLEDPIYSEFHSTNDFPKHTFRMLKRFLEDYKQLENKEVAVDEIQDAKAALPIIRAALDRYAEARQKGAIKGLVI